MNDPTEMPVSPGDLENVDLNDTVRLPVGIEMGDGTRYRNVVIEEMTGIDDHNLAGKKANGNGAVGLSLVLCRCIQEIEGLVERKASPNSLIDRNIVKRMAQVDRDYLFSRIRALGGDTLSTFAGACPRCQEPYEEEIPYEELTVIEWPDEKPLQLEFELEVGHIERDRRSGKPTAVHKKGVLAFPTGFQQEATGKMKDPVVIMDAMLTSCIKRLGTLENVDQEIVKRLKSRDRRYLMDLFKNELPGLRQWKRVECNCGREFDITLDVSAFFDVRRRTMKK